MIDRNLGYNIAVGLGRTNPRISPLRGADLSGLPHYIHTVYSIRCMTQAELTLTNWL
jgi:hypothetical protein